MSNTAEPGGRDYNTDLNQIYDFDKNKTANVNVIVKSTPAKDIKFDCYFYRIRRVKLTMRNLGHVSE